ncbi:MAG: ATPase inhibitor subunit zeta [Hyphomicrobiales bacterium]
MLPIQILEPQDIEASTEGCVNARRDYILGLWAGKQLGLNDDDLMSYVRDVISADHMAPGADPMINKVATDFSRNGVGMGCNQIWNVLQNAERTARAEMLVTD